MGAELGARWQRNKYKNKKKKNKEINTPSVPNYKSFQESWRVKVFQV
jgi:hypothetical protein